MDFNGEGCLAFHSIKIHSTTQGVMLNGQILLPI